jgi:hypothetical protein
MAGTTGTPGVAEAGRKFRDQHSIAAQTDAMVRRLGAL